MLTDLNEPTELRYYAQVRNDYPEIDFATLQINRDADRNNIPAGTLDLPTVFIDPEFLEEERPGFLTPILTMGYPFTSGEYISLNTGTITVIRNWEDTGIPSVYQTDADVAPGSSGGLVVTEDGTPVGIVTSVITGNQDDTGSRSVVIYALDFLLQVANGTIDLDAVEEEGNPEDGSDDNGGNGGDDNNGGGAQLPQDGPVDPAQNMALECSDRTTTSNGFVVTTFLPGGTYRATLLTSSFQTFDPLLIVSTEDDALCSVESRGAREYVVDLSQGGISQQVFGHLSGGQIEFEVPGSPSELNTIDLVIGGQDDSRGISGEFLLIIEGVRLTPQLDAHYYGVTITDSIFNSDVPFGAAVLGVNESFDPFLIAGKVVNDEPISLFECEDAGRRNCDWERALTGSSVVEAAVRTVRADEFDSAILTRPGVFLREGLQEVFFYVTSNRDILGREEYVIIFSGGVN